MDGSAEFWKSALSTRFMAWFFLVAFILLLAVSYLVSFNAEQYLTRDVISRLKAVADSKAKQLEAYARERKRDVTTLARAPSIIEAMDKLNDAFKKGGLRSSGYQAIERQVRPFLTHYTETEGYIDLYLVSPDGDLIFSVNRGDRRGSNYKTGSYKNSELAKVVDRANTLLETELSDFEYDQSAKEPAAFIASPVLAQGGAMGSLVLQVGPAEVDAIAQDYEGLGETGEIVLGSLSDKKVVFMTPVRHDSHAAFRRTIDVGSSIERPLQQAAQGERGQGIAVDYRGEPVLAAWRYLPSFRWGLVLKIDTAEAFAPAAALRTLLLRIGLVGMAIAALAALAVSIFLSCPPRH